MVKKKTSTAKLKKTAKKSSKPKGYQVVGGAKLKDKEIKTSREKMIGQHIGYRYDVNLIPDYKHCLLYTSPSPRDRQKSRMPSSA